MPVRGSVKKDGRQGSILDDGLYILRIEDAVVVAVDQFGVKREGDVFAVPVFIHGSCMQGTAVPKEHLPFR